VLSVVTPWTSVALRNASVSPGKQAVGVRTAQYL
jgi:hypothetical protein